MSAILLNATQPGHAPIRLVTIPSALHSKFCTQDVNDDPMQSEIHTFPHLVLQPWQQAQPTQESRARRMGALGNLCMVRETRIPMFSLHSAGSRIPKVCGPCTSPLVTPLHYNHHVAFSNKSTSLHVALVLGCDATRNVLWTISSQHNGTSGCNQSLKPKTKKVAR